MDKVNEIAMHNRSDFYYKTLYDNIINPLFDAKLHGDLLKAREMVKNLIIYTQAMYNDGDKKKAKDYAKLLDNATTVVIAAMASQQEITVDSYKDTQEKKVEAMKEIDNQLVNVFTLMHKYKLFIHTAKIDHNPDLLKTEK